MIPTLDQIIKFGPVACGLLAFFAMWISDHRRKKEVSLSNLFVVGTSASAIPTALLLIYAAFDDSLISKLSNSGVYIGFAGAALLFVFYLTVKEKW